MEENPVRLISKICVECKGNDVIYMNGKTYCCECGKTEVLTRERSVENKT